LGADVFSGTCTDVAVPVRPWVASTIANLLQYYERQFTATF
jgi:hypothetical protein